MTDTTEARTDYLTVAEVAQTLRLAPMTIYRMLRAGTIPSIRTGPTERTYRIPADGFAAYLAGLEGRRPAPAVLPGQTEIPHITINGTGPVLPLTGPITRI